MQIVRKHVRICAIATIAFAAIAPFASFAAYAEPRVLLLRGWFGVFSTGLDSIADALRAKGIRADVVGHLQ